MHKSVYVHIYNIKLFNLRKALIGQIRKICADIQEGIPETIPHRERKQVLSPCDSGFATS